MNNWKELMDDPPADWDVVAGLMDDDIREELHHSMAPCTKHAFLSAYLELDPQFANWPAPQKGVAAIYKEMNSYNSMVKRLKKEGGLKLW